MVQSSAGAIGLLIGTLYVGFLALMISGWIYLLIKVSEISRNVGAISVQQEQQSRSFASLADSVAVLARNSATPKTVPSVSPEP